MKRWQGWALGALASLLLWLLLIWIIAIGVSLGMGAGT